MSDSIRIFQLAKELNISHTDILDFLKSKDISVSSHMSPIDGKTQQLVYTEFAKDRQSAERDRKEQVRKEIHDSKVVMKTKSVKKFKIMSVEDQRKSEKKKAEEPTKDEKDSKKTEAKKEAPVEKKPKKKLRKISLREPEKKEDKKQAKKHKDELKKDSSAVKRLKKTLASMDASPKKKSYKKSKKDVGLEDGDQKRSIELAEYASIDEIAKVLDVSTSEVIGKCLQMGILATVNQRLEWDVIELIAGEYDVELKKYEEVVDDLFVTSHSEEELSNAIERAPVVTIMGHVDHGKTSILDYIRKTKVAAGESGGITQRVGAYQVLHNDNKITFLDTPGHEAFTAMRARGAQITDIVIVVIAADDSIMPQTKEAISHAQAGGVPIIFAINKIDKEGANPDKVKESLASMNLVVEDWGGKIQSQDISAISGKGIDELLEKVLLEAEIMDLKANPDKLSTGTILEAYLDKGRGYVSTVLVQNGSLKIGDYILAGKTSGKVKAMFDESGNSLEVAKPSTPVSVLGLDGAPQAGDQFKVLEDEKEAKQIAAKRTQLVREQSVRTQKHLTLDEIGRRIAIGDFQEFNVIIKGDVDGSVEALTDSFQNLSTEEIQVNIIFKAVGAITESDVLLASASDAIIIGFNVKPTQSARKLSEKEQIDIRSYSIIYDAINDLKDAMEGMLSPEMKEENTGEAEVRDTFKISRIGTIAGCMVTSGKILRNSSVRVVRGDEQIFEGKLLSLKRFKDDVKEVAKGYDCGIQINDFNDLEVGDLIKCYQEIAVKKKL